MSRLPRPLDKSGPPKGTFDLLVNFLRGPFPFLHSCKRRQGRRVYSKENKCSDKTRKGKEKRKKNLKSRSLYGAPRLPCTWEAGTPPVLVDEDSDKGWPGSVRGLGACPVNDDGQHSAWVDDWVSVRPRWYSDSHP